MLDIIRVLAASLVAFAHLTQPYFSVGWRDLTTYARDAVAVFFVLSGFVIRYVTTRRPATFRNYMGDRLSRIYSVAVPALAFTLIADTISRHVNPSFYSYWLPYANHPFRRVVENLAFCGQIWNFVREPLSNSPYWSINYEVWYYVIYGCYFYLRGAMKWLLIASCCLFVGYQILYLFPLWIAGCLLHDFYQRRRTKHDQLGVMTYVLIFGTCMAGLYVLHIVSAGWPVFPTTNPMRFLQSSRIRLTNYIFGVFWVVIFFCLLNFARRSKLNPGPRFTKTAQFIAEGTFPIYLVHFPLYVLIAAWIPYNHANPWAKILIFVVVLALGILSGPLCDRLKINLRRIPMPRLS